MIKKQNKKQNHKEFSSFQSFPVNHTQTLVSWVKSCACLTQPYVPAHHAVWAMSLLMLSHPTFSSAGIKITSSTRRCLTNKTRKYGSLDPALCGHFTEDWLFCHLKQLENVPKCLKTSRITLRNIVILQYLAVVYRHTVVLHWQLRYMHRELGMIRVSCTNVNVSLVCRNLKGQHFTLTTGLLWTTHLLLLSPK